MKISISNIAWPVEDDEAVVEILQEANIKGVEIAPTKIGLDPACVSMQEAIAYKELWKDRGIEIVAVQALLSGRPDLTLFDSESKRSETLSYLKKIIAVSSHLQAKRLIFGSPRNRRVEGRSALNVEPLAMSFFKEIAEFSFQHGLTFCVEPNPAEYGCDYIMNSVEALELVKKLNHPGLGLHLDTGAWTLASEPLERFCEYQGLVKHFHISDPWLAPPSREGIVQHEEFAAMLRKINYSNWISIEMKPLEDRRENLSAIKKTIEFVKSVYS